MKESEISKLTGKNKSDIEKNNILKDNFKNFELLELESKSPNSIIKDIKSILEKKEKEFQGIFKENYGKLKEQYEKLKEQYEKLNKNYVDFKSSVIDLQENEIERAFEQYHAEFLAITGKLDVLKRNIRSIQIKQQETNETTKQAMSQQSSEQVMNQNQQQAMNQQSSEQAMSQQSSEQAMSQQSSKQAMSQQSSEQAMNQQSSKQAMSQQNQQQAINQQSSKQAMSQQSSEQVMNQNQQEEEEEEEISYEEINEKLKKLYDIDSSYNSVTYPMKEILLQKDIIERFANDEGKDYIKTLCKYSIEPKFLTLLLQKSVFEALLEANEIKDKELQNNDIEKTINVSESFSRKSYLKALIKLTHKKKEADIVDVDIFKKLIEPDAIRDISNIFKKNSDNEMDYRFCIMFLNSLAKLSYDPFITKENKKDFEDSLPFYKISKKEFKNKMNIELSDLKHPELKNIFLEYALQLYDNNSNETLAKKDFLSVIVKIFKDEESQKAMRDFYEFYIDTQKENISIPGLNSNITMFIHNHMRDIIFNYRIRNMKDTSDFEFRDCKDFTEYDNEGNIQYDDQGNIKYDDKGNIQYDSIGEYNTLKTLKKIALKEKQKNNPLNDSVEEIEEQDSINLSEQKYCLNYQNQNQNQNQEQRQ